MAARSTYVRWAALALFVGALGSFVWPTPWRHFTALRDTMLLREHRLTGRVQYLEFSDGSWHAIELHNVTWRLAPRGATFRRIRFEGREIEFPMDATDDDVIQILTTPP